jgi:aspartyl-tRNA(Asn)/glutamyl-tRNA(Gln) amidotransferase subunit C
MGMDRDGVRRLAELAKLRLTPAEEERAQGQIQRLLDAFAVLQEVPTSGVDPSPYPLPIPHRGRPDVVGPALPPQEVLANAPEQRAGCFRVPRMVDS